MTAQIVESITSQSVSNLNSNKNQSMAHQNSLNITPKSISSANSTGTDYSLANITLNSNSISDFNESIDGSVNKNDRDELVEGVMKLYARHNLTKSAVEDIAQLINSVPGASVNIPATQYLLFRDFMSKSELKVFRHIFCKRCKEYTKFNFLKGNKLLCEGCHGNLKDSSEWFAYLNVETQLKKIIDNYFTEIIDYKKTAKNRVHTDAVFDVHDGNLLRNILKKDDFYSMTLNTDGVKIHNSISHSLWPLLIICNFLPPAHRFAEKNIIVAGLHYGSDKPDFLNFFEPLVEEFEKLSDQGIFMQSQRFKFIITHASLDLPCKAGVQNIRQFNGYDSCSYCMHPGEKTSAGVRYTIKNSVPLRNHSNMIKHTESALRTKSVIHGVKGLSPLIGFKHFDLVKSVVIDYMHGVLLGVTKSQLSFWLDSEYHKKPFYITPKQRILLNSRIASIKPCRFISRRLVSLKDYKTFKASQFRHFLIYFYPALDGILDRKYLNHFRLLSSSIYMLLKPEISMEERKKARENMNRYVNEYQDLYGKSQMTMNVHGLKHLVDTVEDMGPLWAYSMFAFESLNGRLKKYAADSRLFVLFCSFKCISLLSIKIIFKTQLCMC